MKRIWSSKLTLAEKVFPKTRKKIKIFRIIHSLPVLITNFGELACVEQHKKVIGHWIICGQTGSGKSYAAWALLDRMHRYWNCNIAIINDFIKNSFDHINPNISFRFKELKYLFEPPKGLPLRFCYPHTKDLDIKENELNRMMYIDWEIFWKDFYKFEEKAKTAQKYVDMFREDGVDGSTIPPQTKLKIGSAKTFYSKEELFAEKPKDVIINLLKEGKIPSIITDHLQDKMYYKTIIGYYLKRLIDAKKTGGEIKGKQLYLLIDEIQTLKELPCITELIRTGQNFNTGTICIPQNISSLSEEIVGNMRYCMAFLQGDEDVKIVAKHFNLNKEYQERIKNFKLKDWQCILATKGGEFILYDPYNNTIRKTSNPIQGIPLPCLSMHRAELSLSIQKDINFPPNPSKKIILSQGVDLKELFYKSITDERIHAISYSELERLGFEVVMYEGADIPFFYTLHKKNMPLATQNCVIQTRCPKDVTVYFNPAANRIRIFGEKTAKNIVDNKWVDVSQIIKR